MFRERIVFCFALALLVAAYPVIARVGKIAAAVQEIKRDGGTDSSNDDDDEDDHDSCGCWDDHDYDLDHLSFVLAAVIIASPFLGPRSWVGDAGGEGFFYPYPYEGGAGGYLDVRGWEIDENVRSLAVQSAFEYGNDFDGLERWTGRLLIENSQRWGFQTDWSYYQESTDTGVEELVVGDFNVVYRFAQSESVQMRAGLGARTLADDDESFWGVNFTYGGDVCLARPLVLSATYDLGTAGSSTIHHGRITLGALWKRLEVFAGYDYLSIGTVGLHGPAAGLRVWW